MIFIKCFKIQYYSPDLIKLKNAPFTYSLWQNIQFYGSLTTLPDKLSLKLPQNIFFGFFDRTNNYIVIFCLFWFSNKNPFWAIKTNTNFGGKKSVFVDSGLDDLKQVIEKEDCRLDWNHLNSLKEGMIKICHKK